MPRGIRSGHDWAMATDALTAVADALYALVPEEFTAARNARAADAKASDPALAKRIAALRRPSPAAWIVNRLARDHADELGDLIGLGGELADAQASGDGRALTALASERRRAVGDLLRLASTLADAADRAPSRAVLDEVERTLVAATVSAEAGAAVRSGRLVRVLQAVGSEVDLADAVSGEVASGLPAAPRRTGRGTPRDAAAPHGADAAPAPREEEPPAARSADARAAARAADAAAADARRRAEAELVTARERAEETERALADAKTAAASAADRVAALRAERDELEERLDRLRDELADAERDARTATRDREVAAHAADRASADLEAAEAAAERLP